MKGGYFVSIRAVSASQGRARDDVIQASFINSDTNLHSWVRVVHAQILTAQCQAPAANLVHQWIVVLLPDYPALRVQEVLDEIRELVESEQLRMRRIDHVFELAQIGAALAQSATSRTVGKIAIRCNGEQVGRL